MQRAARSEKTSEAVEEALSQLSNEQIEQFRKYFNMFDKEKKGYIHTSQVGQILRTMGQAFEDRDLKQLIKEFDTDGSGEIEFEEFAALVARFVMQEDDSANMEEELREAFRLYDKEGNGYINVSDLRDILRALDENITEDELDEMIAEIDTDGSGTVDFDDALADAVKNEAKWQRNYLPRSFKASFILQIHGNDVWWRLESDDPGYSIEADDYSIIK
ncbi:Troponin C, isoform 2 [Trichinella pseudospiralis]|uniref:Troponin C, isoform 2 n=1 Tax=Trichinella pseudospiralis TaxID=6337 RepID=A0A0V1HUC2_TRIPS|nr:Troponin C, isoform 2 [Trichinella pseudospiralis]